MTPGLNLTDYSSAELSVLLHAISVSQIDAAVDQILSPDHSRRRLEILQQWQVKITEARDIVRKEENISNN